MKRSFALRNILGRLAIAAWVVLATLVSAYLLAGHLLTLPEPERPAVERLVRDLRTPAQAHPWMVVHVLDADCGCSQKVLEHLADSVRPRDVTETILLVGADDRLERKASAQGIQIVHVTRDELAGIHEIEAVPLLIVADPRNSVQYMGGYTDRKQGPVIRDLEIVDATRRGEQPSPLPLFGCAVGEKLQKTLDPLSLKYRGRR